MPFWYNWSYQLRHELRGQCGHRACQILRHQFGEHTRAGFPDMSVIELASVLAARAALSTMGEPKESIRRPSLGGKPAAGVLLNGVDSKRRVYSSYRYGRYRPADYNYESILPENQ